MTNGAARSFPLNRREHALDGRWVDLRQAALERQVTGVPDCAIAFFYGFGARVVRFAMPDVDPRERQPDGLPWSENQPSRVRTFDRMLNPGGTRRRPAAELRMDRIRPPVGRIRPDDETSARANA